MTAKRESEDWSKRTKPSKKNLSVGYVDDLVLERANCRLFNDIEYCKGGTCAAGDSEKLRSENERLRDAFKKAEMNWLKERQSLLKEIDALEAERGDGQGYRSNRPDRDHNGHKDNVR